MIKEHYYPGHFYSVIPNITNNYNNTNTKFLDLDYNNNNHEDVLKELNNYLLDFDDSFGPRDTNLNTLIERKNKLQYTLVNNSFAWMDSRLLYYFLQKKRPKKIIEIGSGNSTLLIYNTKKKFNLDLEIICIEPYPGESTDKTPDGNWLKKLAQKSGSKIDDFFFHKHAVLTSFINFLVGP